MCTESTNYISIFYIFVTFSSTQTLSSQPFHTINFQSHKTNTCPPMSKMQKKLEGAFLSTEHINSMALASTGTKSYQQEVSVGH